MNTSDLLAELRGGVLRDADSADALWSDDRLVRYLNDAYEEFAEETLTIRDKTTTSVTQLTLVTGQTDYALNESVLAVYSAQYDTDIYDLPLITHPIQREASYRDTGWFDTATPDSTSGRPRAYQLDESSKTLTVDRAPTATENGKKLFLRVARLPLTLFVAGTDIIPEIPNRYHLALCDGAAATALENHDVDGEQTSRANRRRARFESAMAKAKRRFRRLNRAPTRIEIGAQVRGWP